MAEARPMSSGARALLATFRSHESPSVDASRRAWQGLVERLGHPDRDRREAWVDALPDVDPDLDLDADDEEAVASAPTGAANVAWYAKSVALSLSIAAGLLLGVRLVGGTVTTLRETSRHDAIEAPYHGGSQPEQGAARIAEPVQAAEPAPRRVAAPALVPSEPAVAPEAAAPDPVAVEPRAVRAPRREAEPASSAIDDAEAEIQLVQGARKANLGGKRDEALRLLDEHERRFPSGMFAEERMAVRAEVLCARGEREAARKLADKFLARYTTSAARGRMERLCR